MFNVILCVLKPLIKKECFLLQVMLSFSQGNEKFEGLRLKDFPLNPEKLGVNISLMYFQKTKVNKQKPKTTKLSDIKLWWLSVLEAILVGKG